MILITVFLKHADQSHRSILPPLILTPLKSRIVRRTQSARSPKNLPDVNADNLQNEIRSETDVEEHHPMPDIPRVPQSINVGSISARVPNLPEFNAVDSGNAGESRDESKLPLYRKIELNTKSRDVGQRLDSTEKEKPLADLPEENTASGQFTHESLSGSKTPGDSLPKYDKLLGTCSWLPIAMQ